jgi:antirestriction protein ArdC
MSDNYGAMRANREKVTRRLIDAMSEHDGMPWQKGWSDVSVMPFNAASGSRYHGGNIVNLMLAAMERDTQDPRWMTYKQIQDAGYRLRKGAKSEVVEYYDFAEVKDPQVETADGDETGVDDVVERKLRAVRTTLVYNGADVVGLAAYVKPKDVQHQPIAQALLASLPVDLVHRSLPARPGHPANRAFYSPAEDRITLPLMETFNGMPEYYATVFHEVAHWTGAVSRLNRELLSFDASSESYAREELRAEMASTMLCSMLGIHSDIKNHARYLDAWIQYLEKDQNEIFRAAADAEKIVNYVFSHAPELRVMLEDVESNKLKPNKGRRNQDDRQLGFLDDLGIVRPEIAKAAEKPAAPTVNVASRSDLMGMVQKPIFVDENEPVERRLSGEGRYLISTTAGFVSGFSEEHAVVQITTGKDGALRFTQAEAKLFFDQYANCGYGFQSDASHVEDVSGAEKFFFVKSGMEFQMATEQDHPEWAGFASLLREKCDSIGIPRPVYEAVTSAMRADFGRVLHNTTVVLQKTKEELVDALVSSMTTDIIDMMNDVRKDFYKKDVSATQPDISQQEDQDVEITIS